MATGGHRSLQLHHLMALVWFPRSDRHFSDGCIYNWKSTLLRKTWSRGLGRRRLSTTLPRGSYLSATSWVLIPESWCITSAPSCRLSCNIQYTLVRFPWEVDSCGNVCFGLGSTDKGRSIGVFLCFVGSPVVQECIRRGGNSRLHSLTMPQEPQYPVTVRNSLR